MESRNCKHIELNDYLVSQGDYRWATSKSCENCAQAIRIGDNTEVIMWDFGPPPDKNKWLNEIECQKNVQRFKNGQEIVEASPGSDRYKAMAKYCEFWEDRGESLPPFSGKGPVISP